ncbi:10000_t:CDS:2, partial [Acaulospora colombiana]
MMVTNRIVSRGYEARPAPIVTPHPSMKEAKKLPWRAPTSTTADVKEYDILETTVDDNTNDGGNESSVKTGNTVRLEGLPVNIDETIELTLSSTLGGFGVVGKTGTSIVEGVHEEQGRSTSSTTRSNVTSEPLPVTVVLLEAEEGLERREIVLTEGKVEGLGREVTNDVGGVASPEGDETFIAICAAEAVHDAVGDFRKSGDRAGSTLRTRYLSKKNRRSAQPLALSLRRYSRNSLFLMACSKKDFFHTQEDPAKRLIFLTPHCGGH